MAPEVHSRSALLTDWSTAMPMLRRRRPLLRAVAVGGGAYMAGKHAAHSQEAGPDEEPEAAAPPVDAADAPPDAGLGSDAMDRLAQLGQLHDQGVLTDDEFATQKAALLGG